MGVNSIAAFVCDFKSHNGPLITRVSDRNGQRCPRTNSQPAAIFDALNFSRIPTGCLARPKFSFQALDEDCPPTQECPQPLDALTCWMPRQDIGKRSSGLQVIGALLAYRSGMRYTNDLLPGIGVAMPIPRSNIAGGLSLTHAHPYCYSRFLIRDSLGVPALIVVCQTSQSTTLCQRLLVIVSILCCFSGTSLAGQPETKGGTIQVLPGKLVVEHGYPARFVVVEQFPDGSSIDRTMDVEVTLTGNAPFELRDGEIHRSDAKTSECSAKAIFEWNDQKIEVDVLTQGRTVLPDGRRDVSFEREVMAVLGKTGCNLGTCHGNLHGKGGFRLSLRGDDPAHDYQAIVRGNAGRRIDLFTADRSLLLQKPTGLVAHQGGLRFDVGSEPYVILKQWIDEGCKYGTEWIGSEHQPSAQLTSLQVHPQQITHVPSCRQQQLVVVAKFDDGTVLDVTRWARYEPSLASGVEVSSDGRLKASHPLDTSISVSYLSGRSAMRAVFLQSEQMDWKEPTARTQIDALVERQLQRMRIEPTSLATDNEYLRRTYLVVVGRLPSVDETVSFLADPNPQKYEKLVDSLLQEPGYAALWALRWSDLLRNEQKVMSPKGAVAWHRWIVDQVAQDRPVNEFVAEMVRTVGSTYENPPASFHRTHRDPETAAESIGQVFLGVRLQCARCHNHPFDRWRQDDYYGLAAYFTTLQRKQIDNDPKDKFDKHIISGDEVISTTGNGAKIFHPGRSTNMGPKPLNEPFAATVDNSGPATTVESAPLEKLADWLSVDNRLLARNIANRVWYHYMGRGIVDPPDDFRDSNPPTNPELLEFLTDELIRSDYSVRHLSKLILNSRAFARASADDESNTEELDRTAVFAGYSSRRMQAEVLLDALSDVTRVFPDSDGDASQPEAVRAVYRAEVPTKANFLSTFGKPGRLLVCECERSNEVSLGQSLVLINGTDMRERLSHTRNRITELLSQTQDWPMIIDQLYLASLTRRPTAAESQTMFQYIASAPDKRLALEDLLWALINSQEFSLIR